MNAFLRSLFFVFLSEMGDKTQLVSFAFGSSYNTGTVMLGIFLAVASLMCLTVAVGSIAGAFIPVFWINLLSGILFIGFGIFALRPQTEDEEVEQKKPGKFGPLLTVMTTFFIAELGDKTVLASVAMASQFHNPGAVWLGSTLGMYGADVLAVVLGKLVGKNLPEKVVQVGSAVIFIGAGVWTIAEAFHLVP